MCSATCLAHREHVHAVGADAGDAHALGLLGEVGDRGVAVDGGAHPVEVVLEDEDHRQAPERCQVHRLAEVPGVRRAVAEHADGDVVGALVVGAQREPGRQREVAADDAVAAHEPRSPSKTCIDPPRPPEVPSTRPKSSAITYLGSVPRAIACPWVR